MTRESLKKQYQLAKTDVAPLIDKIYDDFESRKCENCKHLDKSLSICWMRVEIDGYMGNYADFGCSKFERKEDD